MNDLRKSLLKRFNADDLSPLSSIQVKLDEELLLPSLINFIAAYPAFSRHLFDLHGHVPHLGSRLGRGEVLVWFLFDDVVLGGSSSSYDIIIDGVPRFEIKCAKKEGERYRDFMLGIGEVPASLRFFYRLLKLFEKNDVLGKLPIPQNFANISKSKLEELKQISEVAYKRIEEKYFEELLSGPVCKKKYLIFDKATSYPIYFGYLKREQLKLERVSGGLTRLSFNFE